MYCESSLNEVFVQVCLNRKDINCSHHSPLCPARGTEATVTRPGSGAGYQAEEDGGRGGTRDRTWTTSRTLRQPPLDFLHEYNIK